MRTLRYIHIVILLCPGIVLSEWTCTDVASIKNGNTILSCGIGKAKTESMAREKALRNAMKEFNLLCEDSADCRGFEFISEPLRNTCQAIENEGYKCHRGMRYTILKKHDDRITDETLKDKNRILNEKMEAYEAAKKEYEIERKILKIENDISNKNYEPKIDERKEGVTFLFGLGDKPESWKLEAVIEPNQKKIFSSFVSISIIEYPTTVGEVDSNPKDKIFYGRANEVATYLSIGVNVGPRLSMNFDEYNLTLFGKIGLNLFSVDMEDPSGNGEDHKVKDGLALNYGYGVFLGMEHIGAFVEVYQLDQPFFHTTVFTGIALKF